MKHSDRSLGRVDLALASALLLGACATAPELPRYQAELPRDFAHAPATASEPVAGFWRGFADPDLDELMAQAIVANADLRIAAANLQAARSLADVADAQAKPTLGATAGAARVRSRNNDASGDVSRTDNSVALGLDAAWELDLFGRIGNERRAAAANVGASEALLRAAQVSVAAEVARNYFELRGAQEQLRVTQSLLEGYRQGLKLVELRLEVGRGNAFDTERARALVQTTVAAVPALEAALARSRYRLAVLTGRPPTALDARLAAPKPLPGLPATALAAIGSPENLLRRRPDVAAAEQQLVAAAAQVGVARAALWPRITLGGTLGLNAARVGDLGDASSFVYNLGASLVWSLLDGGRSRAQIAAASARGEAAVVQYEKTVLLALEETESALATYTRNQQQTDALFGAAQAAGKASQIARARLDAGSIDFLAVLDTGREELATRDRLAQAQTASATALVAVYKALAGGWTR